MKLRAKKKKKIDRLTRSEPLGLIQNHNSANIEVCLQEILGLRWQESHGFIPVQQKVSSNYMFCFADKAFYIVCQLLSTAGGSYGQV